ncbi:MAG: Ribosomal protein methyltransferase [Pseudomonadota bacterium]|jgi:ribosomal protein L11 methyltransferase
MSWHQIALITHPQSASEIADYLSDLGAISVTLSDAEDVPIYEPELNQTPVWANTTITALYELDFEPDDIYQAFCERFTTDQFHSWHSEILADQNWEQAWMAYYQPMKFADKLWVCPSDQPQYEPNTLCLKLDPGLAFGTGTHPTTALCLEWLASHDLTGKTVVDYGCGSGILAVAAALLGAKQVYAVDIDPQAITATVNNAEKNQVVNQITVYSVAAFAEYRIEAVDVVVANILANPLIDLSQTLTNLLKTDGQLVLSGILNEQAENVSTAYATTVSLSAPQFEAEWCLLTGNKRF